VARRPSHATLVAYVALFVALGGGAYAAGVLPANSVGTRQLRAASVTPEKVAVVGAARLQDSTMTLPDAAPTVVIFSGAAFDRGQLTTSRRDRLKAGRAGIYAISAGLRFPADARGIRALFIARADGSYRANHEDSADTDPAHSTIYTVSTLARLGRGEAVQALAYQETGAPMALLSDPRTFLSMHWVTR
jgi:hypothetical protein